MPGTFGLHLPLGLRPLMAAAMLMGVLALTACSKQDKSGASSQVVARVNDTEISVHQVQAVLEAQPALAQQLGDAASARVLDSLIEQELAAQAARKAGLDNSPKLLQAMELAKRELLARAYQDQLAQKAGLPDTQSVDRYYDEHPELFANRKQYFLQESVAQVPPDQRPAIKAKIEALEGVQQVNAVMADFPHSNRNQVQIADAIPAGLLKQLAYLKDGRSLVLPRPDGLSVLTLLKTEPAPLSRQETTRAITAVLTNQKKRDLVQAGMADLRKDAKVQRMDAASVPAAAPSAAQAASR
jgi:EpsD family peptidyl-prolyl cis-trans isomerase